MTDREPDRSNDDRRREGTLQRDMHLRMLGSIGMVLEPGASILDFGCGDGATVDAYTAAGFDAWGCDVTAEAHHPRTRLIESPYRLPFEDDRFDFAYSDQVFEHVQDYESAIRELARVLRPGGFSLHIFPGRLRPLEPHTFVPGASLIRSRGWLRLWSALGIRNSFQAGMGAREVAEANARYLADHTAYPSRRQIRGRFGAAFGSVRFCERSFLESTWGRARVLAPVARIPLAARVLSATHSRVVVAAAPLPGPRRLASEP